MWFDLIFPPHWFMGKKAYEPMSEQSKICRSCSENIPKVCLFYGQNNKIWQTHCLRNSWSTQRFLGFFSWLCFSDADWLGRQTPITWWCLNEIRKARKTHFMPRTVALLKWLFDWTKTMLFWLTLTTLCSQSFSQNQNYLDTNEPLPVCYSASIFLSPISSKMPVQVFTVNSSSLTRESQATGWALRAFIKSLDYTIVTPEKINT